MSDPLLDLRHWLNDLGALHIHLDNKRYTADYALQLASTLQATHIACHTGIDQRTQPWADLWTRAGIHRLHTPTDLNDQPIRWERIA